MNNKISTKIKIIGILFTLLLLSIVTTTIYLNDKNQQDAMIINIAGKQRMLSQNISKNIFYLYFNQQASLFELDNSTKEFIYNLNSLKGENRLSKLKESPTAQIESQLVKVELLWANFYKKISSFKELLKSQENPDELKNIVNIIHSTNTILLYEIDSLVSLYTIHSEKKVYILKNTQYFFALLILFLIIYSFLEFKTMEKNAIKFLEESKKIMEQDLEQPLQPLKIDAEKELIEASDILNRFLSKINLVINDSNNAMIKSQEASLKLEELSCEFDEIINELKDSSEISKHLNKSEDIAIQTQDYLINSTKRLEELKKELEKIISSYEKM